MAFIRLLSAGLLEIVWAYTLGRSNGFTELSWSLITLVLLLISLSLLESVIEDFGVGMTYAVFTGIGTAGTTIMGVLVFNETSNLPKFISLSILLIGIVGLKLTSTNKESEMK